ncbi:hypothetical protein HDA35_001869 [Micromonospora purpureochromogenes]|uniref:Uncharacterized protein n=1 Tax=Micromonospora purpureochromogenes TaxID=47872 RepID=A0ABX2RLH0_9ACTN|nr:hypothetical protein [Micromonospora purpureochromogenes]
MHSHDNAQDSGAPAERSELPGAPPPAGATGTRQRRSRALPELPSPPMSARGVGCLAPLAGPGSVEQTRSRVWCSRPQRRRSRRFKVVLGGPLLARRYAALTPRRQSPNASGVLVEAGRCRLTRGVSWPDAPKDNGSGIEPDWGQRSWAHGSRRKRATRATLPEPSRSNPMEAGGPRQRPTPGGRPVCHRTGLTATAIGSHLRRRVGCRRPAAGDPSGSAIAAPDRHMGRPRPGVPRETGEVPRETSECRPGPTTDRSALAFGVHYDVDAIRTEDVPLRRRPAEAKHRLRQIADEAPSPTGPPIPVPPSTRDARQKRRFRQQPTGASLVGRNGPAMPVVGAVDWTPRLSTAVFHRHPSFHVKHGVKRRPGLWMTCCGGDLTSLWTTALRRPRCALG